jgi:hypothetical protein
MGMIRWPRAFVFQTGKAILLKRAQNLPHMLAREFETARNSLHIPAFVKHPHHGPAGAVRILKRMKRRPLQWELDGNWVPVEEAFDAMVAGPVAKFAFQNPRFGARSWPAECAAQVVLRWHTLPPATYSHLCKWSAPTPHAWSPPWESACGRC